MYQKINSYIQNNSLIVATAFFVLLTILESTIYQIDYSSAVHLFYDAEYSKFTISICFHILTGALTILFFWTALVSNYDYRIIYFILFFLAVSSEYSYQTVFGRFSMPADFFNAVFASDLHTKLDAIYAYFDWRALIPCTLFGVLLAVVKPIINRGWILFCLNLFLFLAVFSVSANFVVTNYSTNSFAAYYRTIVTGTWFYANQSDFIIPREKPTYHSEQLPTNNIVFIGDESIRADRMSLNGNERDTTPRLVDLEKQGLLLNWGLVVSTTTQSVNSNRALLTGIHHFPDTNRQIFSMTSIFQYAKAMGYKTYYFDGQSDTTWNGTRYDADDFGEITTVDDYESEHKYDIDGEIARKVKEVVASSKGNFIWISKRGTHFPYENSYPETAKTWKPIVYDSNKFQGESKNIPITNNYDNALKYNSELFFSNLLSDGIADQTIYLYTSDHGQSLNQGKATHTSNTKYEAQVPFFILANKKDLPNVDTNYKASHANIFPTVLDLMNYPVEERKYDYALSLLEANASDSSPRYFYTGNIFQRHLCETLKYDD